MNMVSVLSSSFQANVCISENIPPTFNNMQMSHHYVSCHKDMDVSFKYIVSVVITAENHRDCNNITQPCCMQSEIQLGINV